MIRVNDPRLIYLLSKRNEFYERIQISFLRLRTNLRTSLKYGRERENVVQKKNGRIDSFFLSLHEFLARDDRISVMKHVRGFESEERTQTRTG